MPEDILKRNNVNVSGRGRRAILFAHGFGCDQNMWRFVAPAFEDDFRVVLFDYVGSGKSDLSHYDATRYATLDGSELRSPVSSTGRPADSVANRRRMSRALS